MSGLLGRWEQSTASRACLPACVRSCVRACLLACMRACVRAYDHICDVRMVEDPVRAPSSIRRAECKRVYALRQVCGRVNYALSRRVYRHPVNLHRPCGLHSTPRYVRSSVPTHPSIGVPTLHAHESTTEASPTAPLRDKAPRWPAGSIGLDAFMGFPLWLPQTNVLRKQQWQHRSFVHQYIAFFRAL